MIAQVIAFSFLCLFCSDGYIVVSFVNSKKGGIGSDLLLLFYDRFLSINTVDMATAITTTMPTPIIVMV